MTEEELKQQPYYQNWSEILIPRLRENEAWADLFRATSKVFAENIYAFVEDLRLIRDPLRQSKDINIQQAEFLGFSYKSDIFSKEEYANLVTFLNMFNKSAKGIKDFISFIGWIKNAKFQAFQLWANGKKNYSDNPNTKDPFMRESPYILNNSKIHGTGTKEWYPTSHVDLEYDARLYDIDETDIWYLFYKCAPIELVLRSIAALFTADPFELFIGTAVNDYYRVKNVAPCIYEYKYPLYLSVAYAYNTLKCCGTFKGYGYMQGTIPSFTPLINFDKQYRSNELAPMTFSRATIATNYEPYSTLPTEVPLNYPRMCYMTESSEHHGEGLGLLLEPERTNMLTYSNRVSTRRLELLSGTYTLSTFGTLIQIRNETLSKTIGTVSPGESLTFTLEDNNVITLTPLNSVRDWHWFQLEEGESRSSYIPTGSMPVTRASDIATYQNIMLPRKECTIIMEVSEDKIENSCVLLRAYSSTNNCCEVLKMENNTVFQVYKKGLRVNSYECPFTSKFALAIKTNKLKFNDFSMSFDKDDAPVPRNCTIGQLNGFNSINGYIRRFVLYPVYFDKFGDMGDWMNL